MTRILRSIYRHTPDEIGDITCIPIRSGWDPCSPWDSEITGSRGGTPHEPIAYARTVTSARVVECRGRETAVNVSTDPARFHRFFELRIATDHVENVSARSTLARDDVLKTVSALCWPGSTHGRRTACWLCRHPGQRQLHAGPDVRRPSRHHQLRAGWRADRRGRNVTLIGSVLDNKGNPVAAAGTAAVSAAQVDQAVRLPVSIRQAT